MKYPLFASFIIFCLTFMHMLRKRREKEAGTYQSFLDEEARANGTRRKSLDDLNLITIPFDKLPMDTLADHPNIIEYHETLYSISKDPIANLTGLSNTDLKLKYGAPNLELLSRYDASYTTLARTLSSWGKLLYDNGYIDEAVTVLEFAVSTKSDVRTTYEVLGQIYMNRNNEDKIKELITVVSEINSLNTKPILNNLYKLLSENNPDTSV